MGKDDPEATVTAGNASGQNDGAAIAIVTTPEKAAELGPAPAGPAGLVGRRRRAAEDHGHRPGAGDGEGAGPGRREARRHRPDRAQRGLRQPGARRRPASGASPSSDFERTNVNGSGISLGPPGRRDRRADPRHAAARDGPPRRPLRPGDDVHRRRARAWPRCSSGCVACVSRSRRDRHRRRPRHRRGHRPAAGRRRVRRRGARPEGGRRPRHGAGDRGRRAAGRWPSGADVGDAEQVQAAVDRIAAELGPPVVLVNNAGVTRDNLLFKMTDADWDLVMHVHLRGLVPHDPRRAEAHDRGEVGPDRQPVEHLGAGQPRPGQLRHRQGRAAGLHQDARDRARQVRRHRERDRARLHRHRDDQGDRGSGSARSGSRTCATRAAAIPVARAGQPEDIAHTVSFLVSEGAGFVSGQVIYVAGGPKA